MAHRKGQSVTAMTGASSRWQQLFSRPLCGKRFFKTGFLFLLVFSLGLWCRYWSPSAAQTRCQSRLNGTSFMMRPTRGCNGSAPFLVLLVMSSPGEFESRSAIRQTWGSERWFGEARAVTYFVLGHGRERQDWIRREGALHRDIIQGDFDDTYYNLTRKVLVGLEWLCCYCPSASFVMKTDSDMFVNTDYLLELLIDVVPRKFVTGFIFKNFPPTRVTWSRWYISKEEYPGKTYPPFCSGSGYVLSGDVACGVWNISGTAPMFRLEDVYVGLRLADLKVEPVSFHPPPVFFNRRIQYNVCTYRRLVTAHAVGNPEKLLYWREVRDLAKHKCPGDG
ncbi:beta-1,3-galactosyltransferase 5-like [Mobula birostris]|uniref:beta-1,3-galactosyltransferase 5-like n=1 Tax=Mobula birostris TaxID=1983395 RepID=UPI003B28A506